MNKIRSKVSVDVLSKGFKAGKCKTSLKLAMARIKLLKNKREVTVRQMRRDVAQLLESGQDQTARIRVEHVIREEKTMSAYELIEIYCELIVARLPMIEAQKSCPIDLKEAISSVVFASPRCEDLPELADVKKHFVAKYGKEFITSALEIRPDCGVNRMVIEKLSAKAPDIETKIKALAAIAKEHNVNWDSKELEEQFHKPNADLLDGPSTFASASKMPMESYHANHSPTTNQQSESSQNFSTSQYEPKAPDGRSGGEFKVPSSRVENDSLRRSDWNMEFKDATSAAQAAAESAEMASMAARAAAELASRENVYRQSSPRSHGLSTPGNRQSKPIKPMPPRSHGVDLDERRESGSIYDDHASFRSRPSSHGDTSRQFSTQSHESLTHGMELKKPIKSMASEPEGGGISPESISEDDDELRTQGMNLDEHNLSPRRESESIYGSKPLSRSSSHSSGASLGDNLPEVNLHKPDMEAYGHARDESYSKAAASHFTPSTLDADIMWGPTIQEHDSDSGEDSRAGNGEGFYGSDEKQPVISNKSAAVFDDSDSDPDDGNLLDSFLRNPRESSSFTPNIDTFSPKQHTSGSIFKEPHIVEHSGTIKDVFLPSQSDDKSLPVAFDDSGSETEVEMPEPPISPDSYRKNHVGVEKPGDIIQEKSSSHASQNNQPSSRNDKLPVESIESDGSQSDEEPQPWRPSHYDAKETLISNEFDSETGQSLNLGRLTGGLKNKGFQRPPYVKRPSITASVRAQEIPDQTSSDKELVSRRTSGERGYRDEVSPPSEKATVLTTGMSSISSSNTDSIALRRHSVGSRNSRDNKPSVQPEENSDVEIPQPVEALKGPRRKAYNELRPRVPVTYFESDDDEPPVSVGHRTKADVRLSWRTRDSPSDGTANSHSRSAGPDEKESKPSQASSARPTKSESSARQGATEFVVRGSGGTPAPTKSESSARQGATEFAVRGSSGTPAPTKSESSARQGATEFVVRGSGGTLAPTKSESSARQGATEFVVRGSGGTLAPTKSESSARQGATKFVVHGSGGTPSSISTKRPTPTKSESSARQGATESVVSEGGGTSTATSVTKGQISRESSLNSPAHVHPKLPDYDTLAAHFQSLRANRR